MKTFNVMFYLKGDKKNEAGKSCIYCRLTIDGNRLTFSTGEWILPERWKSTNRLANTKSKEEIEIRNELKRIEAMLREAKRILLEKQVEITPDIVLSQYRGEETNNKTLIELTDYYLENLKAKVAAKLKSEATLSRYNTVKSFLQQFMEKQYGKSDTPLKKLNLQFIDAFDLYMRTVRNCANNTTVKYVWNVCAIITLGIKYDWLTVDPFRNYEGKLQEVETVYLNDEELAAIENKVFSTERLNVVRDQFLFSCYTSYAPCDVAKLTRDDVVNHIDGEKWIFNDRTKTHTKSDVLLLPPALAIIERYKNHPECLATNKLFPGRSNQKLNEYLKEIGDLCGIKKNLHYYVSRHTFGTTVTLAKGVPIETVSKIMGHKRMSTTQHYAKVPALLIGTVDKFAMLTWRPEARTLFGFRGNERPFSPPELIIQDELHLISGPLGSMVGLYETMIEELCTANNVKPKIIASSATISRAKEQINSLYGRGTNNVNIFPAQCLSAGDSFFAFEDNTSTGRIYTGIFASALPSHATAQVRVLSALLQSVKSIPVSDEKLRDPYWTALTYFNSIRELGHAATLIRADIREYMNSIWIRKAIKGDERRFINRDIELTSRINSNDIPEYLEQLLKSWTGDKSEYPVDVCLATNMISVGVDIPRLGLMTVIGQPKTTSEYIQATSRVGRSKKGPGIVFTIYNCSKPRDRSHFEHFQAYHSKIYSKVEPTSVTPFSALARERALHAILIGLIRFYSTDQSTTTPRPFPNKEVIERVTQIIYDRVNLIDEEEYEKTLELIEEKLEYWKNELPMVYGKPFGQITDIPLMYSAGTNPSEEIKARAWSTPTSMRNVDSTCEAYVIPPEYINIDN